jgi:cytochrome c oxidase subunit 2
MSFTRGDHDDSTFRRRTGGRPDRRPAHRRLDPGVLAALARRRAPRPTPRTATTCRLGVTGLSRDIYALHMEVFWICVAIAVVVFGVMIYALVKFRHSQGAVPDTTLVHSTKVEIIWTIIPVVILVVMAIPAAKVILMMEDTRNSELSIRVTAYQWKWQYQYMDAGRGGQLLLDPGPRFEFCPPAAFRHRSEVGENYLLDVDHPMVIPSGTKVRLLLTSRT